jgi:hypothetical protein
VHQFEGHANYPKETTRDNKKKTKHAHMKIEIKENATRTNTN